MTWFDRLQFWKPKAERLASRRPGVPEQPKIDVFGGLRLLHRLRKGLWGRVGDSVRQAEERYYGGSCQSKRRGHTRPAILSSDRARELKVSRRPAKPFPKIPEKQRVFVPDPVTGRLTEQWLRPADQPPGTIRAGIGVTLEARETEAVAAD